MLRRVVIVGGGVAALRAGERLAERGYAGRLDFVCGERHATYRRPALSEGFLTGRLPASELRLRAPLPRVTRLLHGVRAEALDQPNRRVMLSDGRDVPYDGLIIATGLRARTLPEFAELAPGTLHHLRTIDDAMRLRAAVRRARRVLIVGGGLVGTEAACSLAGLGLSVTVLDPSPTLLSQAIGTRLGAAVTELHRARGVDVRTGTAVRDIQPARRGVVATLTDGETIRADHVLVAVGAVPEVEWLQGSGLDVWNGVECDPALRAVGGAGIVAAGDVARWPNLRFETTARRSEQWVNATLSAQHAVDTLLADGAGYPTIRGPAARGPAARAPLVSSGFTAPDRPLAARPYAPIPWGWTEQWGVRIHALAAPDVHAEHRIIDGDPDALHGAFALHDAEGRVHGGLVADRPAATIELRRRIESEWPEPPADALANWTPAGAPVHVN